MAKSPSSTTKGNDLKAQTEDANNRAELFEARARISLAQAEITRGHLERAKLLAEMNALEKKSKAK